MPETVVLSPHHHHHQHSSIQSPPLVYVGQNPYGYNPYYPNYGVPYGSPGVVMAQPVAQAPMIYTQPAYPYYTPYYRDTCCSCCRTYKTTFPGTGCCGYICY
ncbi:hypothetical protein ABKN59_009922 [Abortiporus biennis]